MVAWHVYLNGQWIDTVYYSGNCNAEYVKNELINHDGYDPKIVVKSR